MDFDEKVKKLAKQEHINTPEGFDGRINNVINNVYKGEVNMKKPRRTISVAVAAATILLVATITAFAQDAGHIRRRIAVGDTAFVSVIDSTAAVALHPSFVGKLFDADGNEITENLHEYEIFFNAAGEQAFLHYTDEDGYLILNEQEWTATFNRIYSEFDDINEAAQHFNGDFRVPGYIAEGYAFHHAMFMQENLLENGSDIMRVAYFRDDDYSDAIFLTVIYTRGIDEPLIAYGIFVEGDDPHFAPQQVDINGQIAYLIDHEERVLHIEIGNVIYSFGTFADIDINELVLMAESL